MRFLGDRFNKRRLASTASARRIDRVEELAEHVGDVAQSMQVLAMVSLEAICPSNMENGRGRLS